MKKLTILLLVLAWLAPAQAADAPKLVKIAMMELSPQGFEQDTADTLTGVFLSELVREGGVSVISKADLAKLISVEKMKMLLGCPEDDPNCVVEHGHALGDAILIWGSVGRVGDRAVISVAAVDINKSTTVGRASRTVDAEDGQDLIDAATEVADEIRASLGLSAEATWSPILGVSLRYGGFVSGYLGESSGGEPGTYLHGLELEFIAFIFEWLPAYLKVGLTFGEGDTDVIFVPATIGIKYRFLREWMTPYIGLGLGLEFLDFDDAEGNAFSLHVIGGIEINPWKRVGFCIDGGFNFSQYFNTSTKNLSQVGGKLHVGVIYRY